VRCHLGAVPQERTAEEHTTRGPRKTLATLCRGILGGMVSRGWSLSTVPCVGGMYPARISTTSASPQRSSTSYSPESMDGDRLDPIANTDLSELSSAIALLVSDNSAERVLRRSGRAGGRASLLIVG
jgi:hypothetical protein